MPLGNEPESLAEWFICYPAEKVQVIVQVEQRDDYIAYGWVVNDVDIYQRGDLVQCQHIKSEGLDYWEITQMVARQQ